MPADVVEQLGELLRELGFNGAPYDTLRKVSGGLPPAAAFAALDRPEEARLAALGTFFGKVETVPRPDAEEAIRPVALDDLVAAGLVEIDGAGVRARVSLFPFDGLIVVGDPPSERQTSAFVPHVSPATKILAALVVRKPTGAVLDLGTGSGVLAMLAARHAEEVTGVDINPRALSHARLGQRLNRVDNVGWLEGDWLEPVNGRQFDLVLVNPPYAISPDDFFVYRESSAAGDELTRRLLRDSAEHVVDGGLAIVGCNWAHRGDAWEHPVREWVAGLGCDAVLLHFDSQDPVAYAMTWHGQVAGLEGPEVDAAVTRWAEHHRRIGVERVGWGAVVLRRRIGEPNWVRGFEVPGGPSAPGGEQVARVFAGCDFLEGQPAAAQFAPLLSTPWRLVEGHRLDQTLLYQDGAYSSGQAVLRKDGLNLPAVVDMRVVQVLLNCNGQQPLADLIGQTPPPEGLDQSGFHSLCLDTVRHLIATGYLVGEPLESGGAGLRAA